MSNDSLASIWRAQSSIRTRIVRFLDENSATVLLVMSVSIGALALATVYRQGWWRHDDGSLAHSAQRVLAGDLPHRDFADLYTGLLSFLNAGLFALLGEDVASLRVPLFVLFLAFVASFYAIARRIAGPWWAFGAALFAISWSVPVYPAPMPSWYLLFLSTIGTYAVIRFFESGSPWWVFAAGLCGGVGLAIKITAVWFVVAVALALLAAPLLIWAREAPEPRVSRVRGAALCASAATAFLLALGVLAGRPTAGLVIGLLLPVVALCAAVAVLGVRAWRAPESGVPARMRDVGIFALGAALPMVVLLAPYVATRSVGDFVDGVLLEPRSRYEFAFYDMPHPATLLWCVPFVAVLWLRTRVSGRGRLVIDVSATTTLVFLAIWASEEWSYLTLWSTTRAIAPVVIVVGAIAMLRTDVVPESRRLLGLLVLVAGFATLLQFPFAAPLYFVYVAPLLALAGLMTLQSLGVLHGAVPAVFLVVLAIFGFRQLDHQSVESLGTKYVPRFADTTLNDDRGSILVRSEVRARYDRILDLVAAHRPENRVLFAGPDAPEVYFLTDSVNPTPSIMDFLDTSGSTRGAKLLALLEREDVRLVVINHAPEQSPRLDPVTVTQLRSMYEHAQRVAPFEVRWTTRRDDR